MRLLVTHNLPIRQNDERDIEEFSLIAIDAPVNNDEIVFTGKLPDSGNS